MSLVLQQQLVMMSNFGVDTFITFWVMGYIKVFAPWRQRQRLSSDHNSLTFSSKQASYKWNVYWPATVNMYVWPSSPCIRYLLYGGSPSTGSTSGRASNVPTPNVAVICQEKNNVFKISHRHNNLYFIINYIQWSIINTNNMWYNNSAKN